MNRMPKRSTSKCPPMSRDGPPCATASPAQHSRCLSSGPIELPDAQPPICPTSATYRMSLLKERAMRFLSTCEKSWQRRLVEESGRQAPQTDVEELFFC